MLTRFMLCKKDDSQTIMSGELKIRTVAIALVVFSLVNICLLLGITGGSGLVIRSVRFVVTCVFSYFLIREATWARWLIGFSSALGVILSIVTWIGLDGAPISKFSILGIWFVVMAVFYGWVAFMLLFDKDVSRQFNPGSGF